MELLMVVCAKSSPSFIAECELLTLFPLVPGQMSGHSLLVTSAFCDRSTQQKELNQGGLVWIHVSESEQRNLHHVSFTDFLVPFKVLRLAVSSTIMGPFVSLPSNHDFL